MAGLPFGHLKSLLEPAMNKAFEETYSDWSNTMKLDDLTAWLKEAHPKVWFEYKCIKDITDEHK